MKNLKILSSLCFLLILGAGCIQNVTPEVSLVTPEDTVDVEEAMPGEPGFDGPVEVFVSGEEFAGVIAAQHDVMEVVVHFEVWNEDYTKMAIAWSYASCDQATALSYIEEFDVGSYELADQSYIYDGDDCSDTFLEDVHWVDDFLRATVYVIDEGERYIYDVVEINTAQ
ncbi:MAG: hypothetical protein ABH846_02295 [Patescibacteria group bacterium]